jgi:FKBP-type peptidyl-prolyl cis-trans isomerase
MKIQSWLILVLLFSAISSFAQQKDTVTTSTGLKYVRLKEGNGVALKKGQKVKVFYTGKLTNGKKFDSNVGDKPFQFKLGTGEVIPGWDEGVMLMSPGEKGVIVVPSELGYGREGVKNPENEKKYIIPPDATLIFEIEVVK